MSDHQTQIVRIANKLKLLLKQQEQLRKENERLKTTVTAREQEIAALKETLATTDEKLSVMKASAGRMEGRAKQDFEKKINQYIKDIDKAIAYMNA